MSQIPENLKYTKEHEWTLIEGDVATIGITDFAQDSLGDIVFVELPETGRVIKRDEAFGVVESIKSVSDLYSPLSGEVLEANSSLSDSPEMCNSAPYEAWMIKLKVTNPAELDSLLDGATYQSICEQ